jgi:hypothetical protein
MADEHHAEPRPAQLAALAAISPDGPLVALNLNRYRERAAYPAGTPDADVSGREAYLRYGLVAVAAIKSVGGRVLWATAGRQLAIGCDHDVFQEVVAVWYPSRACGPALLRRCARAGAELAVQRVGDW